MSKVEDFMNRLHQQASGGDEARKKQGRAIMRSIGSWMRKPTTEYLNYMKDGTAAGYLGGHSKRACVEKEAAWDYTKKTLEDTDTIKEEFDTAYDAADEEPWWRACFFYPISIGSPRKCGFFPNNRSRKTLDLAPHSRTCAMMPPDRKRTSLAL